MSKQKKRWQQSISVMLSLILIISSLSLSIIPQKVQAASGPELIVDYEFTNPGTGAIAVDKKGNSSLTGVSGTHGEKTYGNTTETYGTDNTGPYWQWTTTADRGGGFTLDIDPTKVGGKDIEKSYTISVRFSYNSFAPNWTKIIDYKNKTADTGFYFNDTKELKFYDIGNVGSASASPNSIIDIIATRDETTKKFTAYMIVNGVFQKEIEVNDAGGQATPTSVDGKIRFGFFHDDYASGGAEKTTGGKVYSIKFWDGAVIPANVLDVTAKKGTVESTTDLTLPAPQTSGNTFKVVTTDKLLTFPMPREGVPAGAIDYSSGDLAGVDPIVNKYVGIYEVDTTGQIVGFRLLTLTTDEIKQPLVIGPAGIANPHLWLRADKDVVTNAGKVETWRDQSENGHDFTQIDANKQPEFNNDSKRLNFNKAVTFNGTSSYLVKEGGVLGGQSYNNFNAFAVAGIGHLAQNSLFWENIKGSGGRLNVHLPYGNTVYWDAGSQTSERVFVPSPITLGHYYAWNFNYGTTGTADSGQSIYRDGKETVLSTNRTKVIEGDANQNMFLGSQSATNGFYKGQVGELIFYSKPLTAIDRQKVNSYLAIKYGISLDMIDYLAADGTTWWTADATYNYNIAGIALDDAGSLHQRQSRSVNDTSKLTIGIGTTLLPKNEEVNRNGDLTNGQALVWGSNDKGLNFTQSIAGTDMKHSERIWKVQNTGNVGQVTIAIPKNVVGKNKLSLLTGADSTNFTAVTPIQMTETTFDGEVYFVAQATLANGQYFTFAADTSVSKTPGGIDASKLSLWVKADSATSVNGNVTAWKDETNENDFSITGNPKIESSSVNFNPSVSFDGIDYFVGNKSISMTEAYTVAMWNGNKKGTSPQTTKGVILSPTLRNGGADYYFWNNSDLNGLYSGDGSYSIMSLPKDGEYNLWNTAQGISHKDGSVNGNTNGSFAISGIPQIGKRNEYTTPANEMGNMNGNIAEIVALNAKADTTERNKVDSYLALKYGITLNNGASSYVDTASTPVWTVDATYKNNIAGITRDDAEALYQKQSRSINAGTQVVIGLDTLVDTNSANNGTLTDKQYLIWGDNGAALKFTKPVGTTDKNHAERIWKVQNKGSVGEVNIAIPKVYVPTGTTLLVGTSETDFTSATSHPMTEVAVGGTDYYVAKATLANGQYFTFAADVPVPQSVKVEEITANQNQIVVTFDKDIKLTAPEANGFTVTVGTETITLTDADVKVDPANPKQLLITLPAGTDTTGKAVKVAYNGQGNLTGTNNVPVNTFEKELTIVDKTALQNKVTEIEGLTPTHYTSESWSKLQEKLTEAKAVLTNPTATQQEVNAALQALEDAQNALKAPKPTSVALTQTVTDGNKVTLTFNQEVELTDLTGFTVMVDGTLVTPTVEVDPTDSKKVIFTLPNGTDVTNKEVKVIYNGAGNLKGKGATGAPVENFEMVAEDPYSAAFQITQPDAVTANPQPTIGGKVDVTTTPSTVTIVLKNDKDEPLLVDVAATVDSATGEWTFTPPTGLPDGTYTIIATATNGQQTVTKKHTFTVATTPIVNKVPLQQKVNDAKNLVAGEYTPASWAQYQEALKKANEVLTNPNATQEEVDKALAALTAAQNALVTLGKGLGTLTPSTGTLSPSFQTGVTDYTMTVGYPTSVIDFTAIPVEAGATVTTTVNGQPGTIGQIPLQVGENIIVISVKDVNGNVRHYTIKVYRQASTGGGSWTPNPTQPVTPIPTPGETKTKIQVELEIDGEKPLEKTTVEIERTKHANGDITDFVALTEANAKEAVAKAKEIGNDIARIVLPDVNDEVKEAKVEIPKESLKLLRDNGLALEISSENGHIAIPVSSMEGIDDNFYFRLVPVKKESERQAIEERARAERVVRATLQSNDVHVVARPMTIETNMPSHPVQVTLPLKGVKIPTDAKEREALLKQLAVFIEHSDGEKKVVIPEVVTMAKGELGLRFTVEKFSTFTIIQVNKEEETKSPVEVKEHEAYIKGFPDGTFGPEKNVTRAQVATMIARILGYTDGPVNTAPFKDIPSDHYAAGAIAFVKERGIMNGDVHGNFRASENITRAQMATVVANFKQLPIEENVAITFNDTKGHWAQWIIEANRVAGIINGRQDGSFAPEEYLTRAQAVIMMNRMFERGPLQGVTTPSFPDVKATHWAFKEIEEAAKSHAYFIDEDGNEQLSK